MINSTDFVSVYRQIFNAVIRPNLWLPYFQARGTIKEAIKALIFYIVLMLLIMSLGSISVNLLKPESTTTLVELLINPTLAMHIVGSFVTFCHYVCCVRAYLFIDSKRGRRSINIKTSFYGVFICLF